MISEPESLLGKTNDKNQHKTKLKIQKKQITVQQQRQSKHLNHENDKHTENNIKDDVKWLQNKNNKPKQNTTQHSNRKRLWLQNKPNQTHKTTA